VPCRPADRGHQGLAPLVIDGQETDTDAPELRQPPPMLRDDGVGQGAEPVQGPGDATPLRARAKHPG
jgi:hypothetical protein